MPPGNWGYRQPFNTLGFKAPRIDRYYMIVHIFICILLIAFLFVWCKLVN
jgi:hypothetical protein